MVDALKNLMSIIPDTILQQVIGQVRKTMWAVNSRRKLSTFDYVPAARCKPSQRHDPARSHCWSDEVREVAHPKRDRRYWGGNRDQSVGVIDVRADRATPRRSAKSATGSTQLKKALYELADKGQIDWFLKRGPRFLNKECEPARVELREEECSMETVAIIVGVYVEGITRSA
ncbi:hypothetical protein Cgig2_012825 [Carnegiea gigantea]|uniref:Uncharacterized protein n=1 Tax=Carnegiea gigantea TaxID=171969 RepID=A0A9Q1QFT9_9CARY|nr:hypothetical protein Cgig2_012825 [Carnegiea gigantea]